jgi:hypothetical protein
VYFLLGPYKNNKSVPKADPEKYHNLIWRAGVLEQ